MRALKILTIFSLLLGIVCASLTAIEGERHQRPMILAAYYIWYHDGEDQSQRWSMWTRLELNNQPNDLEQAGEPEIAGTARPLIGLYSSADPVVAEWHVQLAQAAGIDAFLVSWWDDFKGRNTNFERGILPAAEKHGFKIALLDERAQFHDTLENYQRKLASALKKYQASPAYLKIDDRPVVYLYQVATNPGLTAAEFLQLKKFVEGEVGPVYWIVDKIAHDAKGQRKVGEAQEKTIPADWRSVPGIDAFSFYSTFSNFRADRYEQLIGKYRYLTKQAHDVGRKMMLPVHPGHDNSRFSKTPYVMPRRDGDTLRDYLRAATDAHADFILLTSWNEWPETTVIEPSSSWPDPYLYLRIIAEWKGLAFTEPPLPSPAKTKQP